MTDREQKYAGILSSMIQCETISSKEDRNIEKFNAFQKVLKELFPNVFSRFEVKSFDGSLLLRLPGRTDGQPFLFMSHQDVVPAEGAWQYEPFSGHIDEKRIWGRGTVDTKGSLMCIFQAAEELLEEGFVPEVDFYIASSCNEEVSGDGAPRTVQYLLENNIRLGFLMDEGGMIVEDPMGGVKGRFAMVGTMEKGAVNFKVSARSNGGHASTPGKNSPIARLSKFVVDLEKHNPNKAKMPDTVTEMLTRMGRCAKGPLGFLLRNARTFKGLLTKVLPLTGPSPAAMVRTTMAFTMAQGSHAMNVMPEEAHIIINSRLIHHQGVEKTTAILKEYCDKYDLELEVLEAKEPQKPVDFNGEAFKLVERTVNEIYPGVIATPYLMTGNTDAYHYWRVTDNAIRFAPLAIDKQQLGSVHAKDENIFISSLPQGVDFYKSLCRSIK